MVPLKRVKIGENLARLASGMAGGEGYYPVEQTLRQAKQVDAAQMSVLSKIAKHHYCLCKKKMVRCFSVTFSFCTAILHFTGHDLLIMG
jgi:hypothetical protein